MANGGQSADRLPDGQKPGKDHAHPQGQGHEAAKDAMFNDVSRTVRTEGPNAFATPSQKSVMSAVTDFAKSVPSSTDLRNASSGDFAGIVNKSAQAVEAVRMATGEQAGKAVTELAKAIGPVTEIAKQRNNDRAKQIIDTVASLKPEDRGQYDELVKWARQMQV